VAAEAPLLADPADARQRVELCRAPGQRALAPVARPWCSGATRPGPQQADLAAGILSPAGCGPTPAVFSAAVSSAC